MDREGRIGEEQALALVQERLAKHLRELKQKGEFSAVHIVPEESGDVPDEASARLVVISPRSPHSREQSRALAFARDVLEHRGTAPRRYKNMLLFAAAGADEVLALGETAKRFLAWKSVSDDAKALNLDETQREEVATELGKAEGDLTARLDPAYQWLLVPEQDGTNPIAWRSLRSAGNLLDSVGALPVRASNQLVKDELLLPKWSPANLDLELKRYIWRDGRADINVRELWELFATYVYLPRLRDANTLLETIRDGTAEKKYFGYATSKTPEGGYAGLASGRRASNVFLDDLGVVVRPEAAAAALTAVETPSPEKRTAEPPGPDQSSRGGGSVEPGETPAPQPTRFYGRVRLSAQRLGGAAGQVGEEIVQHLAGLVGADVRIELDISVHVADGIPDRVVRTVSENASTLKFESFGFEEE